MGGFEAECSLIKDRLITGASQPGFCSADKRIILERREKKQRSKWSRVDQASCLTGPEENTAPHPLCAPLKSRLCNQSIEYSSRLHFNRRKPIYQAQKYQSLLVILMVSFFIIPILKFGLEISTVAYYTTDILTYMCAVM